MKFERDLYLRVVSMTAESAAEFVGEGRVPLDLGPADPERYKEGSRVWGFTSREETAEEKAHRIWTVAHGGLV